MYSIDEVNARDLYFSNPMEVFLGQDFINKSKHESGISSSFSGYNQNGNSTDSRCRSSQDLFPFEKADSQFEASNADYHKYISQNLLVGTDASPKDLYPFRDDKVRKEKSLSPKKENQVKDIRQSLDALNKSLKELNSEIGLHNKKVNHLQEEVSKLKENVASIEDSIGKKIEIIDENYKTVIRLIKTEVIDRISETNVNINKVESKLDDYVEQSERKLQEAIENVSKSHVTTNKKHLQNIQTLFSKVDYTVEKMDKILYTSIKDIKTSFEKTFEQKMQSPKNYIHNSMYQLVVSPDTDVRNSMVQEKTKFPQQSPSFLRNNVYTRSNYKCLPITTRKSNADSNYQYNSIIRQNVSRTVPQNRLQQTPLAQYVDSHEKSSRKNINRNFIAISNSRQENPEYKDGSYFTNVNIKRKVSTPLAKVVSPFQSKSRQRMNSYHAPVIKRRSSITNISCFEKGVINFLQTNKDIHKCNVLQRNMDSSPALSVYQAATLAKGYATHL